MPNTFVTCAKTDCRFNEDGACKASDIFVDDGVRCATYEPRAAGMLGMGGPALGASLGGAPGPPPGLGGPPGMPPGSAGPMGPGPNPLQRLAALRGGGGNPTGI